MSESISGNRAMLEYFEACSENVKQETANWQVYLVGGNLTVRLLTSKLKSIQLNLK